MAGKKILIVDDEVGFTRLIKLNLEQTGKFEVKTENQGSQALNTARDFKPDLILLDIIMPDMDGSTVANQMKNDPSMKNIPILFLTALVKEREIQSTDGTIGGFNFISKPITTEELVGNIEKVLGETAG